MDERLVVVVGYPDAELLDVAYVTTSLVVANDFGRAHPPYGSRCHAGWSADHCPPGLTLQSQHALERLDGPLDTLVISGGRGCEAVADDPQIVAQIRRLARRSRRVHRSAPAPPSWPPLACSTDVAPPPTGVTPNDSPLVTAVSSSTPPPYTSVTATSLTAAGVTSALDLRSPSSRRTTGPTQPGGWPESSVTYLQRPANQAQVSMFVSPVAPEHRLVRRVVDHVTSHLDADLTTTALAALAGVSERHLTRLFVENSARPPAVRPPDAHRGGRPAPCQHVAARVPSRHHLRLRVTRNPPPSVRRPLPVEPVALPVDPQSARARV